MGTVSKSTESLKEQVLLQDFNEADLKKVSEFIKRLSFKNGECIFKVKDEARGLYLIETGKVEISMITKDGWRQTLAIMQKGDFFGELALLRKRKHLASAFALEETSIFFIPKTEIEILIEEDISLAYPIVKRIAVTECLRLERTNNKCLAYLASY